MNLPILAAETTGSVSGGTFTTFMTVGYLLIIGVAFYLIAIRPQKKQQKAHAAMLTTITNGDSVLTSSGFYGVVIDVMEDVVILEFGNNKNCRIPMQKSAIIEVEKSEENK
ncbi:preprotein translocase subunit YajC [Anaerosporobacter sp.]